MARYAAFLRGINVGGRTIKMEPLRKTLERLGFEDVQTLLASGNVVFSAHGSPSALRGQIEGGINKDFGMDVHVILRSKTQIDDLIKSDPFKGIKITPKTRLYITFLSKPAKSKLKTPYKSLDRSYKIIDVNKGNVASMMTLTGDTGTVDAMEILEKEFGKDITTRNWNTVQKVAKALE
jgi:uncharacterized protein (DUF1697 family)